MDVVMKKYVEHFDSIYGDKNLEFDVEYKNGKTKQAAGRYK